MQLIFDSDSEVDIKKMNMSLINNDHVGEKFSSDSLITKLSNNDSPRNKDVIREIENTSNANTNDENLSTTPEANNLKDSLVDKVSSSEHKLDEGSEEQLKSNTPIDEPEPQTEAKKLANEDEEKPAYNTNDNSLEIGIVLKQVSENNVYNFDRKKSGCETENVHSTDEKDVGLNENTSSPNQTDSQCTNKEKNIQCEPSHKSLELPKKDKFDNEPEANTKNLNNDDRCEIQEIKMKKNALVASTEDSTSQNNDIDKANNSLDIDKDVKMFYETEANNMKVNGTMSSSSTTMLSGEVKNFEIVNKSNSSSNKSQCDVFEKCDIINESKHTDITDKDEKQQMTEESKITEVSSEDCKMEIDNDENSKTNNNLKQDHVKVEEQSMEVDSNTIEINDDSSQDIDVCTVNISNEVENHAIIETEVAKCESMETSLEKHNFSQDNCKEVKLDENLSENRLSVLEKSLTKKVENKKTLGLSNALDILSDDEESEKQIKQIKNNQESKNDGDDEIYVIDEEACSKDSEKHNTPVVSDAKDCKDNNIVKEKQKNLNNVPSEKDITDPEKHDTENGSTVVVTDHSIEPDTGENVERRKTPTPKTPLLSHDFLSSCKKKLCDMTRNELEDFCVLRIVESVVERGNLGELKSQLKKMNQSIEEHRQKVTVLTKQNQDLQVVLRSVQEEVRKNNPITPLKITRCVGIQVLISDKGKGKSVNQNATATPAKPVRSSSVSTSPQATPNTTQAASTRSQQQKEATLNIPVPRLVPAKINQTQTKIAKPVKRTFSKPADTVDLTDDEPPMKVATRPVNQVRVVSPQNLMPPRNQIGNPRRVYIPIQAQSVSKSYISRTGNTQNVRPRVVKKLHPAPLPESSVSYQPNCKQIPPSPEISLSEVENGIVISWKMEGYRDDIHENIVGYQIYAYQETSAAPNTALWKKIGDVRALPLPMACTLTQFVAGFKYYFAVRALDAKSRLSRFSIPGSIMLLNK